MNISDFLLTEKYPMQDKNAIQLYSLATPNGVKVALMLEETGLKYEAHTISFSNNDQFSKEFLQLNPNNKIPAIIDPNGINGEVQAIFESGAILLYLSEKTGKLLSTNAQERYQTIQWLFWQCAGFGPMLGQFGYFYKFAGKDIEDKRPLQRYVDEAKRLLGVLDKQLSKQKWLATDEFSIADIATFPWVNSLINGYQASEILALNDYKHIMKAFEIYINKETVQRAMKITPFN